MTTRRTVIAAGAATAIGITAVPAAAKAAEAAESVQGLLGNGTPSADVIGMISARVSPGDIVLIKGSQSIRMERITKALMSEPARAGELLVRQEAEWLEKA